MFVNSKDRARLLHRELMYDGAHVDSISADQSNAARNAAIDNFRLGRTWVLICTDLVGRGLDFVGVNTVGGWVGGGWLRLLGLAWQACRAAGACSCA